jgi:Na+-transporting methylmalonyl-CoA/oxaloacetate decarboxylase beta subunit
MLTEILSGIVLGIIAIAVIFIILFLVGVILLGNKITIEPIVKKLESGLKQSIINITVILISVLFIWKKEIRQDAFNYLRGIK